jgi:hypothetical protein
MLALPYQTVDSFERLDATLKLRARFAALAVKLESLLPGRLRRDI